MLNSSTSRYVVEYSDFDDETRIISRRIPLVTTFSYRTHTCGHGESFASLALQFLGTESLFWYVADFNPTLRFIDYIDVGTVVRIPLQ